MQIMGGQDVHDIKAFFLKHLFIINVAAAIIFFCCSAGAVRLDIADRSQFRIQGINQRLTMHKKYIATTHDAYFKS